MFSKIRAFVATVTVSVACLATSASAQLAEGYYTIAPAGLTGQEPAGLIAGSFLQDGSSTPVEGLPPIETYDQLDIVWAIQTTGAGSYYITLHRGASIVQGNTVFIDSDFSDPGEPWNLEAGTTDDSFSIVSANGNGLWLYPVDAEFRNVVTVPSSGVVYISDWAFTPISLAEAT